MNKRIGNDMSIVLMIIDLTLFEAGSTGKGALDSFHTFWCLKEKERQSCFKKKKEPVKEKSVKVTSLCCRLIIYS